MGSLDTETLWISVQSPQENTRNTSLTFIFNYQKQESLRHAKRQNAILGLAQKSLFREKGSGILLLISVGQQEHNLLQVIHI